MQNIRVKDVDLDIQSILGRSQAEPDYVLMAKNITGKTVMVTGAGGSIGSEICRQIINYGPRALILFESNEYALYSIHSELARLNVQQAVYPILGSVQNRNRVQAVMEKFEIQTVYHAAAYKHVPMVEYNLTEGVMNNFVGTSRVVDACISCDVETFVLVSTDKAVRPTNVMGASKRLAEMYVQHAASEGHNTKFSMVRFGNVLGSSGSVIPLFLEQIGRGEPLTVTHRDITRYFMSIPEAAQLVIQAGAMANGGEVFVLDMGQPVKIADLAQRLNTIFNRKWYEWIEVGLRPGEKLYEELLIGDNVSPTNHPKIMKADEPFSENIIHLSRRAAILCDWMEYTTLMDLLRENVAGFQHSGNIHDYLYEHHQSN